MSGLPSWSLDSWSPPLLQAIPDGDGWITQKVLQGEAGQTLSLVGTAGANNDLVVKTTGLTTPTRQDLYRSGQPPRLLAQDPALIDSTQYTVEIGSAPSKDGTSIDYYLLKPKSATPARAAAAAGNGLRSSSAVGFLWTTSAPCWAALRCRYG